MSEGFTPGPWATYRDQLSVGETQGHSGICEVWERHGGQGFENARLIAAAPDLLEALESAQMAIMGYTHQNAITLAALEKARAAIAKARGTA
ncbi:hypothetical protein [Stutzerimonas nitrititolerans]|uniref:hypothetical protein n=1 Tax=Stutzerimonas nitrititolerans TaxID=2482751 RepID=UPI0028A5A8BE|nr:hypothetical protein [Stutzerimonas nitrititolerans]